MTNVYTVTFNVADGSFEFYSKEAWKVQIAEWREELELETSYEAEDIAMMDYYEVVELLWGDEMFIDFVTPAKIK
jgi:hypothetical protein